jgi:hypothetical protein
MQNGNRILYRLRITGQKKLENFKNADENNWQKLLFNF